MQSQREGRMRFLRCMSLFGSLPIGMLLVQWVLSV